MKQILCGFLIFSISFSLFFFPKIVAAHVLEKSNTVGGILHINPDDDPIIGKESSIYVELKDTTNQLRKENCICTLAIRLNGKTLFSQPLFKNVKKGSYANTVTYYTFPKKGLYTITVVGKPRNNAFRPFTFSYSLRVTREQNQNKNFPVKRFLASRHFAHFIGIAGIIVFVIIAVVRKELMKRRTQKK